MLRYDTPGLKLLSFVAPTSDGFNSNFTELNVYSQELTTPVSDTKSEFILKLL